MERERGGRPRYPGVLTPAEQRVLEALRDGGSNAEIAARLGISRETVKTHIASMLSKLDLPDRYELAVVAARAAAARSARLARPAREASHRARGGDRGRRGDRHLRRRCVIGASGIAVAGRGARRGLRLGLRDTLMSEWMGVTVSCSSGFAVTNPTGLTTNTELVEADCEALLGLRDTLRRDGRPQLDGR